MDEFMFAKFDSFENLFPTVVEHARERLRCNKQAMLNCVNFPHRRIIRPYLEFENYKILELCLRNCTNLLINNLLLQRITVLYSSLQCTQLMTVSTTIDHHWRYVVFTDDQSQLAVQSRCSSCSGSRSAWAARLCGFCCSA
ncbi:hypothetical protein T01_1202 [Trichinella spiralis]|uniref:Uncharacterized protein n=1 Tax=Trichinella spiralis TaxID=6334 RepID=A0A0V1BHW0_TRISP|nr:hypothetical protein T01_1202 [Trichinella spiralis]